MYILVKYFLVILVTTEYKNQGNTFFSLERTVNVWDRTSVYISVEKPPLNIKVANFVHNYYKKLYVEGSSIKLSSILSINKGKHI